MTTINIRTDEKLKKNAGKVLKNMGLDMSTGIKLFLHQVVLTNRIPFPIVTENGLTPEEEQAILKASEEAKQGINTSGPLLDEKAIDYLKELVK